MKNNLKTNIFLLMTTIILSSPTMLAVQQDRPIYIESMDKQPLTAHNISTYQGMKFIENRIGKGEGKSSGNPIILPVSAKNFVDMKRLMNEYPNWQRIGNERLIRCLDTANTLNYVDLMDKIHQELVRRGVYQKK